MIILKDNCLWSYVKVFLMTSLALSKNPTEVHHGKTNN